MYKNKLTSNCHKCVYITVANGIDMLLVNVNIIIKGKSIKSVEHAKYLGVYVDYFMKRSYHITYITKMWRYFVFVFKKLSKILSVDTLQKIYQALINSVTSHGIIAWKFASESAISQYLKHKSGLYKLYLRATLQLKIKIKKKR